MQTFCDDVEENGTEPLPDGGRARLHEELEKRLRRVVKTLKQSMLEDTTVAMESAEKHYVSRSHETQRSCYGSLLMVGIGGGL